MRKLIYTEKWIQYLELIMHAKNLSLQKIDRLKLIAS